MTQGEPWWEEVSSPEISVDGPELAGAELEAGGGNLHAERFGKYLIVGELALGGMAELFLAVHRGLEGFVKVVVIKRVLPQFADNAEFVRMFIDEARTAARLEHSNIVRTYEFGEIAGQYYTVMEYLAGEDLAKVLGRLEVSRQGIPFHTAANLMSQVCAGLHFAHELTDSAGQPLGLVHRDINPANIVLTYAGEVKVIDFGVAKSSMHAKTSSGTIKGKLAYMSPEHLLAEQVDRRSDVFAIGIVLWELIAGRPLFVRDNEAATLYAIMNDAIPSLRRFRPDVPSELEAIVVRALERKPADRFDSAEELQLALDAFLDGQDTCDARARARLLEGLFGSTRAEAKRSIAQTRALARNISLVMKLRSEARADLAETVDAMALGTLEPSPPPHLAQPEGGSRLWMAAVALGVLAAIVGSLLFVLGSGADQPRATTPATAAVRASLQIVSSPPGAAITIGGEPTGLVTPATLSGITTPTIALSLELPGYEPRRETIEVPPRGAITEHFAFSAAQPCRLVIAGLSAGAAIIVDGEAYDAGTVIPVSPGRHQVRIVVGGRTVAEQSVDATAGDQIWKFVGDGLERSAPGT